MKRTPRSSPLGTILLIASLLPLPAAGAHERHGRRQNHTEQIGRVSFPAS